MKKKDIERILDVYSDRATGKEFGDFCWRVLEGTLKRKARPEDFAPDFWGVFIDKLFAVMKFAPGVDVHEWVTRVVEGKPETLETPVEKIEERQLTPAEEKRKKQMEGL